MHGELRSALCAVCGIREDWDGALPPDTECPNCGERALRPDIVFFGEMPYHMDRIEAALAACDLFVSIGTSGAVYPAAGFVQMAEAYGADTLELNLERSAGSGFFAETRLGPAGELVPAWVEVDRHAQDAGEFGARARADVADADAALAQHDRALRRAFDQDLLVDFDRSVLSLAILFRLDRAGVGQFGVELKVELFARHLAGERAFGGVGDLILRIMPRPLRHRRGKRRLELGKAIAGLRRDEPRVGEMHQRIELFGVEQQLGLVRDVDLVEDQDLRLGPVLQRLGDTLHLGTDAALAVHHERDHVCALGAAPRGRHHRAVETALRFEDTGRVDQQDLRRVLDRDAEQLAR
ncbi:hypothetical protein WR25_17190 [Diploscapter pachys]|uniref:Deacetylase sirtuin-type domain-containing protein n=1 Tax=Diploscapter pachys TaxID=2018661 RepID=A0A2A2KJ01_9BILA|nr:hypothetical protein WR25_17190 [Diploscapter pachys]